VPTARFERGRGRGRDAERTASCGGGADAGEPGKAGRASRLAGDRPRACVLIAPPACAPPIASPPHATLRFSRPDQLSWFAPDPIHTVAPPRWE
jgi:hypothetical protein